MGVSLVHTPPVELGIAGFGYAFGEDCDVAATAPEYLTDPARALSWGAHTFHRASPGVYATSLAAAAASEALARLAIDPNEVDFIVLANSEVPEYHHWDGSAALARELNIERTRTLWLNQGCGTGVTGLGEVAAAMALNPDIQIAMVVAVNRVSEFHRNRMNVNNSVHSDGAVAAVVCRGHRRLRWLATEQFTDGALCDWFRTDYGGAANPLPPPGVTGLTAAPGYERIHEHFGRDPQRLREFMKVRNARVVEAVDTACARAGLVRADIDHLIYINDRREAVADIAGPIGVPIGRTNAGFVAQHGHMGAADQMVSLGQHVQRGDLRPGEIVALCGMSIGMHWCATLLAA